MDIPYNSIAHREIVFLFSSGFQKIYGKTSPPGMTAQHKNP